MKLPREVVLASAGTGKTYTLSSRMVGLLAAGAPPESLLATTFTRKAAGEILNRVLGRLAEATLGEEAARELAGSALLDEDSGLSGSRREQFAGLLLRLVGELHRTEVGTLDAFFARVARCFPGELDMPHQWRITDPPRAALLEAEALHRVLMGSGSQEMVELVRMAMRGESGRGVHSRLLEQLGELRALLYQKGVEDPDALWRFPVPDSSPGGGVAWEDLLRRLESAPVPANRSGDPDGRFVKAVASAVKALRDREWEHFCRGGLVRGVLTGSPLYYGVPVPEGLLTPLQEALDGVRAEVGGALASQAQALRALVLGFDGALAQLQRREGAYRFDDLTYALGGLWGRAGGPELWYRLDQRTSHLLLDEFQDTSRPQWEALEPLVEELVSGEAEGRSGIVVADPKQSIYGWRGAEPEMVRRVADRFGLAVRTLDRSYRSSAAVLDLVNRVFRALPDNPVWDRAPELLEGVRRWSEAFPIHRPARELRGFVTLRVGPVVPSASEDAAFLAWAVARIRDLHSQAPDRTVGVLVRRNTTATRLAAHLRALGVDASEEGSSSPADSPAVAVLLALLHLADHPGDTVARYTVAESPLGEIVGLKDHDDDSSARRIALRVRRDLLVEGYGPFHHRLVREMEERRLLGPRDLSRLRQLVELAYAWGERPTLRPGDFVRFVRSESREAPSTARVRVMTVHKAKGLEFDAVVLPELDDSLTRGRGLQRSVLPLRDRETGRVLRIFPKTARDIWPLFPDLELAGRQDLEREVTDALGVLYVALTRARHALLLLTAADPPGRSPRLPRTFAGLIRGALEGGENALEEGAVLYRDGDEAWSDGTGSPLEETGAVPGEGTRPNQVRFPSAGPRTRLLSHRSPSGWEEGGGVRLLDLLSSSATRERALQAGTLVHAWLESLEWLDEWAPSHAGLLQAARERAPEVPVSVAAELAEELVKWIRAPEIAEALTRPGTRPGESWRVRNELPFAARIGDVLYQGRMDRVVLRREGYRVAEAHVLDYKTDLFASSGDDGLGAWVERHRPQLEIYRRVLAGQHRLPLDAVRGGLVFLRAGKVVWLEASRS